MRILFVCLGNICRSAAAEAVLCKKLKAIDAISHVEVDSAGTGAYHIDEMADARMSEAARQRGYMLTSRARQITREDLQQFDLIITMDECNYQHVLAMLPEQGARAKLRRFMDFCTYFKRAEVPDPYYGDAEGFALVLDILEDGCDGIVQLLKN